jgi:EAL domain-containing protein (putative c-di-GMP-specific phosphodiesterase class I)
MIGAAGNETIAATQAARRFCLTLSILSEALVCSGCSLEAGLGFEFTMAFQPIVDLSRGDIYAYEALVRGLRNEPAGDILARVNSQNRYRFDQMCRVRAIELASALRMPARLSINFNPNAVYRPETCLRATLKIAAQLGFPHERIIFEITEGERIADHAHLREIVREYKRQGFRTAIDDFGAGYAGLHLLTEFQPDIIKLDMALIRNVDQDRVRQVIVRGVIHVCHELGISVIAEGVETREELLFLRDAGIQLFQGYYFARPGFEMLPSVSPNAWA